LVVLKGLISGYHSDMQETKFAVMSGISHTRASLVILSKVVMGLSFDATKINEELDGGFAQATEIADHLAMGGLPFREAHERSGKLVKLCEERGTTIPKLPIMDVEAALGLKIGAERWAELISSERARLKRKVAAGGPAAEKEMKKLEDAYKKLLA
jgi:argininosuccinate lyase